jgi:lysophospholipase L1-like esterase
MRVRIPDVQFAINDRVRRFVYWYLPVGLSLIAATVFAYGFVAYVRGETGTPVDAIEVPVAPAAPAATIAPIILGDSLARGAGDESGRGISGWLDDELRRRKLPARRTLNVGVNGARTKDLLELLDRPNIQRLLRESNMIIVSIGGNDLWGGNDWRNAAPRDADAAMDQVMGRIETTIEKIRSVNPKARIFFVGLYNPFVATPMGKEMTALVNRWNARLLEHFGNDPDFTLVATSDLFSHRDRLSIDRFHPGREGYSLIARRIADAL